MNKMRLPERRRIARNRSRLAPRLQMWVAAVLTALFAPTTAPAAELSVGSVLLRPGTDGRVVVSGAAENVATFGFTIMVELVPRAGNVGELEFTRTDRLTLSKRGSASIHRRSDLAEEVRVIRPRTAGDDILEVGDPWPDQGSFSIFDTGQTGSPLLNGAIGDNGTFIASPIQFRGALTAHPIRATADAQGIWDVVLSTSRGDSSWEGLPTTLQAGTVIVSQKACVSRADCNDGDSCTSDSCDAGFCRNVRSEEPCTDRKPSRKKRQSR